VYPRFGCIRRGATSRDLIAGERACHQRRSLGGIHTGFSAYLHMGPGPELLALGQRLGIRDLDRTEMAVTTGRHQPFDLAVFQNDESDPRSKPVSGRGPRRGEAPG
jgi:hypothetical protein